MVDVRTLKPGDRVKIVDAWVRSEDGRTRWNSEGCMDRYLGTVMTVEMVPNRIFQFVKMQEDGGEWSWFREMLDYVLPEEEFQPGNLDVLFAMLKGDGA